MLVAREVHDDLVQPRRELAFAAKFPDAPVNSYKRILRDFRRVLVVAQQLIRHVERALLMPDNEFVERPSAPDWSRATNSRSLTASEYRTRSIAESSEGLFEFWFRLAGH